MEERDFRREGFENFVKTELVPWLHGQGFIKPDYETIGKILCELYKGEEEKFEKLSESMTNTVKDAREFLESIKNKT